MILRERIANTGTDSTVVQRSPKIGGIGTCSDSAPPDS